MKVVIINNLYGNYARGGAERVVDGIAGELLRQKHEVMVISSRPLQISDLGFKILDLRTILFYPWNLISYYNLHKLPKFLRPLWHLINIFNVQSYLKIKGILKKENPDIIMTHNLMGVGFLTPLAIFAYAKATADKNASAGKRKYFKHVHTLHDIQLLHPSGLMIAGEERKVDGLFAKLYQRWTKKLFSSVDIVISPSRWLLNEHLKRGFFANAKKEVMGNPSYPTPALPLARGGSATNNTGAVEGDSERPSPLPRGRLGAGKGFIFLYVGQIEKHKGVHLLIEAFGELKNENYGLWIVGEGSWKIPNTTYQIPNTTLLGKKNAQEVRERMRRANCLVVPSLCYENQPTVIIEAIENNLPVIASDIGGIPEIVPEPCLFRAGDKESLARKMRWVIDNYDIMDKRVSRPAFAEAYVENLLKL